MQIQFNNFLFSNIRRYLSETNTFFFSNPLHSIFISFLFYFYSYFVFNISEFNKIILSICLFITPLTIYISLFLKDKNNTPIINNNIHPYAISPFIFLVVFFNNILINSFANNSPVEFLSMVKDNNTYLFLSLFLAGFASYVFILIPLKIQFIYSTVLFFKNIKPENNKHFFKISLFCLEKFNQVNKKLIIPTLIILLIFSLFIYYTYTKLFLSVSLILFLYCFFLSYIGSFYYIVIKDLVGDNIKKETSKNKLKNILTNHT